MAEQKKKSKSKPKKKRSRKHKRRIGRLRLWWRFIWYLCLGATAACIVAVVILSGLNPPKGHYMRSEETRLGSIKRQWVPLEDFSPHMARAVVAAEDANFCNHAGFDFDAIRDALADGDRGASTITQQVAKNVFLWHGRTWVRKGLEAGFALLIETFWSKKRIIEVYLNVAEFDEGVFGAGAAAKHYFGRAPANISLTQASRMAAVLPSPQRSSPLRPSAFIQKRARQIASGANTISADGRSDCFE